MDAARALAGFVLLIPIAFAPRGDERAPVPAAPSSAAAVLKSVGFDQELGATLPLEREFTDQDGARVALRDCFRGRPVLLAFVYYKCPMLCTLVMNGLVRCVRAIPFDVGREYDVVAISIDPRETPELARAKRDEIAREYGRERGADGFRFLVGAEDSIRAVTASAGFRYVYDAATGQFAHASGLVVATPDGRLSRYCFGVEYPPRDVRLALVEASAGRIGSLVDQLLLICFHYDPATGRYGLAILTLLRALGIGCLLLVGVLVVRSLRRERRMRRRAAATAARPGT